MIRSSAILIKLSVLLFSSTASLIFFNASLHSKHSIVQEDGEISLTAHVNDVSIAPTTVATSTEVLQYLNNEEQRCLNERHSLVDTNYCPCLPPHLKGHLDVNISTEFQWSDVYKELSHTSSSYVLAGGQWKPSHCVAHNRLAVIIPFRDRDSHLRVMLRHLIPVLQRQLTEFMIFVVEQNYPAVFNKAAMMDIGFLEAERRFPQMNCVMFHDVDHLMEDDRLLLNCGPYPHHYAVSLDEWNYKLLYLGAFGGVVTMRPEVFRRINGYPLTYFGWGGEDDDMGFRVKKHYKVFRPPLEIARYTTLKHLHDNGNPKNGYRLYMINEQLGRYQKGIIDGVTDVSYTLNEVQMRQLYTWLHVDMDVTDLPYPHHPVSNYVKVPGVCDNQDIIVTSHVSLTTCRYMCDIEVKQPCLGFTYHLPVTADSLTSQCDLIIAICQLNTSSAVGFSYFKLSTS